MRHNHDPRRDRGSAGANAQDRAPRLRSIGPNDGAHGIIDGNPRGGMTMAPKKGTIFEHPEQVELLLGLACGTAIAYILVQNMRYTLDQVERDKDSLGNLLAQGAKDLFTEGTKLHESAEMTNIGPVFRVTDVITGQSSPIEEGKEFIEDELSRAKWMRKLWGGGI